MNVIIEYFKSVICGSGKRKGLKGVADLLS